MKLFYSPFHTFIHKVLVTAHEAGLWDELEFVPTYPFYDRQGEYQDDKYSIAELNPLDKVPTLVLDDGTVVYASQAIVECLDSMSRSGRHLFPSDGPKRWEALTRMALSDAMFESTVALVMEGWHPEEEQRMSVYEWIWPKLIRGLDELERCAHSGFNEFDIGQAAMLHALSYMNFRSKFYEAKDPLYPGYDWMEGRPNLTAWWDEATTRPSVTSHYNREFEGDDSVEFCQRSIRQVLEMQRDSS